MGYYDAPEPEKEPFVYTAAKLAVAAPIVAIMLSVGLRLQATSATANPTLLKIAMLVVPFLCLGLVLIGATFGIMALCNTKSLGREGLLKPGVWGLVLNGLFLGLFIHGFVNGMSQAVKARESQREIRATQEELRASMRNSFDSERGVTNVDHEKLDRLRAQLDKSATHSNPKVARESKAASAFLAEIQVVSRALEHAMNRMNDAEVLQLSGVTNKAQLQTRREAVQNYAAANERVRSLVTNSAGFFRTELQKLGAPPASIEASVRDLQSKSGDNAKLVLAIRDTDTRLTGAMTQILDLLDQNWSGWKADSGVVTFQEDALATKYNALLAEIEAAAQEQVALQRKLISRR